MSRCERTVEAARWDLIGTEERAAFEAHAAGCDACGSALAFLGSTRELLRANAREPDADQLRTLRVGVAKKTSRRGPAWAWLAAPVAAAASIAVWFVMPSSSPVTAGAVRQGGALVSGALPVGAALTAEAGTQVASSGVALFAEVETAFEVATPGWTEIRVNGGTMHFDVAPRSDAPFVVRTPHTEVRVIGTRFAVQVLSAQTDVRVDEGRVEVRDGDSTVRVAAGRAIAVPSRSASARCRSTGEARPIACDDVPVEVADSRGGDAIDGRSAPRRNADADADADERRTRTGWTGDEGRRGSSVSHATGASQDERRARATSAAEVRSGHAPRSGARDAARSGARDEGRAGTNGDARAADGARSNATGASTSHARDDGPVDPVRVDAARRGRSDRGAPTDSSSGARDEARSDASAIAPSGARDEARSDASAIAPPGAGDEARIDASAIAPAPAPTRTPAEWLAHADTLRRADDYAGAAEAYAQAASSPALAEEASWRRAEMLGEAGDPAGALVVLAESKQRFGAGRLGPERAALTAQLAVDAGEFERAVLELEAAGTSYAVRTARLAIGARLVTEDASLARRLVDPLLGPSQARTIRMRAHVVAIRAAHEARDVDEETALREALQEIEEDE